MEKSNFPSLSRPIQPVPTDVREALVQKDLLEVYRKRPPYQHNDYRAWISRARRPETRDKRLAQMLDELERGNLYLKMRYRQPLSPRGKMKG